MRFYRTLCLFALLPAALLAQRQAPDTVRASRFDLGRMWTFEYTPSAYFSTTYGFDADSAWFARARLAALRIPGCSAAFVSRDGLIITNHHCVRGSVNALSRPGETLLDSGFVAATLADERRIPGMIADQLLAASTGGSHGRTPSIQAIAPRALCIRFSACLQIAALVPESTPAVTSSPRRAGRQ